MSTTTKTLPELQLPCLSSLSLSLSPSPSPSHRWGPSIPSETGIPYAVFSKRDNIGKPCDWAQTQETSSTSAASARASKYSAQYGQASFNYRHEQDEASFNIVDSKASAKTKRTYTKRQFSTKKFGNKWENDDDRATGKNMNARQQPRRRKNRRWYQRRWANEAKELSSSVKIDEKWPILSEIVLKTLRTVSHNSEISVEEISELGNSYFFDSSFDRLSTRNSTPLLSSSLSAASSSPSEDPVFLNLMEQGAADVYLTDEMLAMLMACPSSLRSWDLLVRKRADGSLVFDSRPQAKIGHLTVHETSSEVLPVEEDSINHDDRLREEATLVDAAFRAQVRLSGSHLKVNSESESEKSKSAQIEKTENSPNSISNPENAEKGFRYRRFTMSSGLRVLVRCDASLRTPSAGVMYLRTLLEFDSRYTSGVSWRQKLETQRGFVVATEFKNNTFKMSRFIAEALVGGAEVMRIGFVSRKTASDNSSHRIVGTLKEKPERLALQVGLTASNFWGVFGEIVGQLGDADKGSFLVFRVPNTDLLRIYGVPDNHF